MVLPSIMTRKIIKIADKTFAMTLPNEWLRKFDLGKGDELDVNEQNDKLVVSTEKSYKQQKIHVDLEDMDERTIRWYLSALHKYGYDEIEIRYHNKEKLRLIQELLKNLYTGFNILQETESVVILKSIAKENEEEFENTLRRAFRVTIAMGEELLTAIKAKNIEEIREIKKKELVNNQLTNFCERILNKRGYNDFKKNSFLYVIIWNLEKVCDNYKYICDLLLDGRKFPKDGVGDVLNIFHEANEYLDGYYNLFYEFDGKKLNELSRKKQQIFSKIKEIKENDEILHHISTLVIQITDFSASMIAFHQD